MDIDELMQRLFEPRDDVTYPAARKLFEKFSTPKEMVEADNDEIEVLIRDVGFTGSKQEE